MQWEEVWRCYGHGAEDDGEGGFGGHVGWFAGSDRDLESLKQ